MHVTPEQFVDVAEGARAEASLPHLVDCRACRDELAAVRAALTTAAEAEVPEPSPLFWNGFSARVRARIDADESTRWWILWIQPRPLVALSAVAMLVAMVVVPRLTVRDQATTSTSAPEAATMAGPATSDATEDLSDPMLTLVADLSTSMDWDAAADAGFAGPGAAEAAVTHLSPDELRSLRQMLQELTRPGA